MPSRYDTSTKAKAIRLVREHRRDYPTQWLRSPRSRVGWG